MEEELSTFPIKEEEEEEEEDTKKIVKMSCLCKAGQFFLTVNHRGPLPLRELHSTDEKLVWRDPGGSWACLRPVYHYGWIIPSESVLRDTYTGTDGMHS